MKAIIIIGFIVVLALGYLWYKPTREYFGGPVKHLRRIPKTSCWKVCGQYYADCMDKYGGLDAGFCQTRLESCKNVCNYSDFMVI